MTKLRTPGRLVVLFFLAAMLGNQACSQTSGDSNAENGKYLQDWLLLGPIVVHSGNDQPENAQLKADGFDADLLANDGGEAKADPQDSQPSSGHGAWKLFKSDDRAIDLSKAIDLKPWAVAYAAGSIRSEDASTVVLGIGSDDAIKVWLNGESVHENWTARQIGFDDDLVTVRLRQGDNRLLLKVMNEQGDWAFSCRVMTQKDLATQLVKAAARRSEDRINELMAVGADVNVRGDRGLTPYLAAKIKGNDEIAEMLVGLGAKVDVAFDPKSFVETIVREDISQDKPGIAVLISKGDEILYSQGFGSANIENDVEVTTDTKFRIGSVSKQFTAAAILKLQENGKLSVSDKLSEFIPDFPRGDEITLHHLLTHTSGLKNFTSKPDFYSTVASRIDADDMIKEFKANGFDFDPGEKFAYCNTGYFLLSYIVQEVSGVSFDEYLKTTFFEKLGMRDTGVHESTGIYKHEATGYSMEGNVVKKAIDWDMSRAGGAGNIYSTVKDLHRWNQAVFHAQILNEQSLKAAHQVYEAKADGIQMPYGYGWVMDEHRGLQRIGHSGGLQGFVSQLNYYPEHDVSVVALHNAFPSVGELAPGPTCDMIAEAFLWKEMKARPKHVLATDVDPDSYDDYVGKYDYPGAMFTVHRVGNKLMAQVSGQPPAQIYPAGDDKFFWKIVDADVAFIRDAEGKVNSVRHHQGIATFVAPRVKEQKEIRLTKQILDRYVGKYKYAGLGELTIRRDDDQLLAKMTGQTENKLFAKSETEFFWRVVNAQLKFTLDDDGKVIGATHHQGGSEISVKKIE